MQPLEQLGEELVREEFEKREHHLLGRGEGGQGEEFEQKDCGEKEKINNGEEERKRSRCFQKDDDIQE